MTEVIAKAGSRFLGHKSASSKRAFLFYFQGDGKTYSADFSGWILAVLEADVPGKWENSQCALAWSTEKTNAVRKTTNNRHIREEDLALPTGGRKG